MRQKEKEVEGGVTEQGDEIEMEDRDRKIVGKTADLTDTTSTRQMVTKAQYTLKYLRNCAYSVCNCIVSAEYWENRKTNSISCITRQYVTLSTSLSKEQLSQKSVPTFLQS